LARRALIDAAIDTRKSMRDLAAVHQVHT